MYHRLYWDFDYARLRNGQKPAKKYYDSLTDTEKVDLKLRLDKLGNDGTLSKRRFKKLKGCDIWQLSINNHRILCFKLDRCLLFTNGFPKESKNTRKRHIDLAKRIMKEHLRSLDELKGRKNV